jgi:hypothetical protein
MGRSSGKSLSLRPLSAMRSLLDPSFPPASTQSILILGAPMVGSSGQSSKPPLSSHVRAREELPPGSFVSGKRWSTAV